MTSSGVFHGGQFLQLALHLVEHPEVIKHNSSKIILLLLSTAHVNLIEHLDGCELSWHLLHVADADLVGLLRSKFVDEYSTALFIVVVETRLL